MLTEIPVPYYAKDILPLSAALTKADITPYGGGLLRPPAEDLSPDVTAELAVVGRSPQPCSVRAPGQGAKG